MWDPEGDDAVNGGVASLVDGDKAATADLFEDFVFAQLFHFTRPISAPTCPAELDSDSEAGTLSTALSAHFPSSSIQYIPDSLRSQKEAAL